MNNNEKVIIAFVGMPGAGKSEAVLYLKSKGIPFVRFGDVTDEGMQERGLPPTQESERVVRESIRKEFGMAAYAMKSEPKIEKLLETNSVVALDGLYSWEEYLFLIAKFPNLKLIHIYAERKVRYKRLITREVRPLTLEQAKNRDVAEIEKLNKGGPIAIADYIIVNEGDRQLFLSRVDKLFHRLEVHI